jgi:hypothetical protein
MTNMQPPPFGKILKILKNLEWGLPAAAYPQRVGPI